MAGDHLADLFAAAFRPRRHLAFTAIVACINNTGPGLNQVGPASNFSGLNDFETWVCTFAMLIGRLEMFSVFVLFTPEFWRR